MLESTSASNDTIRVLLVDDHPIVCGGMKALLERESDMQVVGEAGDGLSAQLAIDRVRPHVVVMDLSMPRMGGISATQRIKSAHPEVKVLALSGLDERTHQAQALNAGASGFMPKRAVGTELVRAIRAVARGGVYLDPSVTEISTPDNAHPALSERESEALKLLAAGHSANHIAERLAISVRTLETYRARAMEKLGLKTRVDIIRYAAQNGWLGLD